jgi:hypothetical protein
VVRDGLFVPSTRSSPKEPALESAQQNRNTGVPVANGQGGVPFGWPLTRQRSASAISWAWPGSSSCPQTIGTPGAASVTAAEEAAGTGAPKVCPTAPRIGAPTG